MQSQKRADLKCMFLCRILFGPVGIHFAGGRWSIENDRAGSPENLYSTDTGNGRKDRKGIVDGTITQKGRKFDL